MPLRNFLVIFVVAVVSFACYSVTAKNRYANLFAEVMDIVNQEALIEFPRDELLSKAIGGMLEGLDRHSVFISDSGFREFKEDLQQEFGGVGMYVALDPKSEMLMVLAPMPNTPAHESGIRAGDLIVSIAGKPTVGKLRKDAVKELRGPVGETVDLEIQRGDDTLFKTLTRAKIPIESAHGDFRNEDGSWSFVLKDHPEVGYLRLSQFGEMTGDETRAALRSLPDNVEGLIIDLRANPGGLPTDLPVCILIDRHSASASEIVSGCLQDHGRAILIGEQSYGKGTVQDIIPIQHNKSLLKLTTASYWRPSDRQIDREDPESKKTKIWGVQPDEGFEIEMSDEELVRNLQQRSSLDLSGLVPEEDSSSETNEDAPASDGDGSETAPSRDSATDNSPNPILKVPHIDRPLQKAIEFIQSSERSLENEKAPKKKAAA